MQIRPHRNAMRRRKGERGSVLIELALCISCIWLPLFLGTLLFGFNLIRDIQVTQVCRDAGHMYAFGTDFSQTSSKQLLAGLAPGLGMTATGGQGVVVLSAITYVDNNLCIAAGLQANSTSCPNLGKHVFIGRVVVGLSSLHASVFGTPAASIVGSDGRIAASDYLTNASAVTSGFTNVITLSSSAQFAYVSEMWVKSSDFNFWSSMGPVTIAARSVF